MIIAESVSLHGDTANRSNKLRAALSYARRGRPIFPLKPGGKEPLTKRGHLDATTDQARITAWFNRWPNANIGMPTGERSGVLALDVDHPPTLDALEAEHGKLPATRTHSTGSGGMHYLFTYPAGAEIGNSAGKLGVGLDVRGEGGYIVVPPSATTRPYEVLDREPLADPPAWLVEALREPPAKLGRGGGARGITTAITADLVGPPIFEGARDDTLTRICGKRHDGTRTLDQLTDELLAINEARCKPPLPEAQVLKITRSIHRRPVCKPARETSPQVLQELDRLTIAAERREWDPVRKKRRTSIGGHTDRDVYIALLRFGRLYGEMIAAGVRVSVSIRDLALEASVGSTRTVMNALDRLRVEHQLIRRDSTGSGPKSGALVLLTGAGARGNTHPPGGYLGTGEMASVSPCVPPLSAVRLRWSAVGHGGRLGKIRGRIIDVLDAAGPLTLEQIAGVLGRRPYDLRRRTLPPLLAAGVVECCAGEYRLTVDWRVALYRRRKADGEIAAAERQRKDYDRDKEAFREAWKRGEIVSKEEFARRRRNRDRIRPEERHVSGAVEELDRVPKLDPDLLAALREFLRRNPDRTEEPPSWLSVALWAEDYTPTRPPPEEIGAALLELAEVAA